MFCNSCGQEISNDSVMCTYCGAAQNQVINSPGSGGTDNDSASILWGLLGCCIPLAGLILFLVWKDQKPQTAKRAGIGALIGVSISVISSIIYVIGAMLAIGF